MRKGLRTLAVAACITAASALGTQMAVAGTGQGQGLGAGTAKCGEMHRHHGERGERFFQKIARELGMSDQQKSQAKAILKASRAENKQNFSALQKERGQMRMLILSGNADEEAVRAQSAKIAAVQADLAVQRAREAKQLLALLTPEQVTKLREIMEKRQGHFRGYLSSEEPPAQ